MEKVLNDLQNELKGFIDKAKGEQSSFGTVLTETKSAIDKLQSQVDSLELKLAAPGNKGEEKTFGESLKENESVSRLLRDKKGHAVIEIPSLQALMQGKTTITSAAVGSATSGILMFDRTPGIVPEARRTLRIRDLLTAIPTSMNAIDFVKVNAHAKVVSPQTEASAKAENEITFTTATANVRTIATWIPATKQVLDDFEGLEGFLRTSLAFAHDEEVEDQILSGNNTGQNLNGLTNQATAYTTSLTPASAGWQKVDIIGRAIQQIASANEVAPTAVVLNPVDMWDIRLSKDNEGRYIFGNPNEGGPASFFGLTPVVSNAMTSGYFLVGSLAPNVAVVRQRQGLTIEISTEHSDYFTKNMIAIRAESRLALVVFRPGAHVYGALTTSPA